jgi:HAD superfamily hydrolase (TIGR01509 family)
MWALLVGYVGAWVLASRARRRRQVTSDSKLTHVASLASVDAILIDVDGTLIDSNAAHAETWAQALGEHGFACDASRVRPLVGMGGDKLLRKLAAVEEDSTQGRAIAKRKKALFAERLPGLAPTLGARALIGYLRRMKKDVVVATSADDREMNDLLRQAGVADLIPRRTSKDDASESKPDPDIVQAALKRARAPAARTVMIGHTPYDVEAARRAGVETIALRCGGHWSDEDLDGAIAVLENPAALLGCWQR